MRRVVLPEKLDSLPEDSPAARSNRRDLRRINRLMGNFRWMARAMAPWSLHPAPVVEWAAGDGALGCFLARRVPAAVPHLTGVDRWSRPACWPSAWNWWQGELQAWPDLEFHPRVIGNLILHQLEDDELRRVGEALDRHVTHLAFTEPLRHPRSLILARLLGLLGVHPVTRHDSVVSVRAGFRDEELPRLLGLDTDRWQWKTRETPLGAYRFAAWKREAAA